MPRHDWERLPATLEVVRQHGWCLPDEGARDGLGTGNGVPLVALGRALSWKEER